MKVAARLVADARRTVGPFAELPCVMSCPRLGDSGHWWWCLTGHWERDDIGVGA